MRENFLHYLWKFKKFDATQLKSCSGAQIELLKIGQHNHNSGPDFFNAQLYINGQLWAGNVEIHVRSSDWYAHGHGNDPSYQNVILHVVWEHDAEISRSDGSIISTLELRRYVNARYLSNYYQLFNYPSKWINCESQFPAIDEFEIRNWLERLFLERLERKSLEIEASLQKSNNDWEAVLFKILTRSFGSKVNGEAFSDLAAAIDFSIIRKERSDLLNLEALFFGLSGLLNAPHEDPYFKTLKNANSFLNKKYQLSNPEISTIKFFRLRPSNFPTIRLSQLANLYHYNRALFSKLLAVDSIKGYYQLFETQTSSYWQTHYNFGKASNRKVKKLTSEFIDLILINSIIPLKFSHAKQHGQSIDQQLIDLMQQLHSEKNSIITRFNVIRKVSFSALDSQALIELKTNYCQKNKCLHCRIGHKVLSATISTLH